jgi:hypothetical protein
MTRHLLRVIRRRVGPVAGACVLLAGGIGAGALAGEGTAQATTVPCAGAPITGGNFCTATGQLTFSPGPLNLLSPTALTWAATGTGANQLVFDTNTAHQTLVVVDATGSGGGWNVNIMATTFTSTSSPFPTLANTGTFSINGSVASQSASTAPTAACTGTSTCTLPTDTGVSYPLNLVTALSPTSVKMYNAPLNTGMGSINIGYNGAAAIGWWLALPANTVAGTYNSTVTLEVVTGP